MSVDINLILYNHNFIKNLEQTRNIQTRDIKLKFVGFKKPNTYTSLYRELSSMSSRHPDIRLSDAKRKCLFGDCSEIEEILVTNKNFPFYNEFHLYNISGTIRVVDKVRLNELNNNFYIKEIQRYKKMLIQVFTDYKKGWTDYKTGIDECYVQSCYVDPYYDCGPVAVQRAVTDEFIYPDLFIDAGPDIEIWWPTWLDLRTSPLDSLISQQGPTHAGSELYREWVVSDDDSIDSLKATINDDSELFPIIERDLVERKFDFDINITLTMKVTWPWIVAEDSRNVKINYYSKKTIKTLTIECNVISHDLSIKSSECDKIQDDINSLSSKAVYYNDLWCACYIKYQQQLTKGPVVCPPTPIPDISPDCDAIYVAWLFVDVGISKLQPKLDICKNESDILQAQYDECLDTLNELIKNIQGSSVTYKD